MLLIDFNQTMIAHAAIQLRDNPEINLPRLRATVLGAFRNFSRYRDRYGRAVIAADSNSYWRRDLFPHYKAKRKVAAEKSGRDWTAIHETIEVVREEIKEHFAFPVVRVPGAEADDVIATLTRKYCGEEDVMIISADHDFVQLQTSPRVKQYDPIRHLVVAHDNPEQYLLEHVLRGDVGDGVPNVLSPEDCFVTGKRQTALTQPRIKKITESFDPDEDKELTRRISLNMTLISFDMIPADVTERVLAEYETQLGKSSAGVLPYLIKHRLNTLVQSVADFQ